MEQSSAAVEWRAVVGFEGRYEVSDDGRVRRVERYNRTSRGNGKLLLKGKEIYQHQHRSGSAVYFQVVLWVGHKGTTKKVHSLVAEAFLGPRPAGLQVCHCNGASHDNRAANLRYDTAQGNIDDRDRNGSTSAGERNGKAKLTAEDVVAIRGSTERAKTLAERYGVHPQYISTVKRGHTWKCIPN